MSKKNKKNQQVPIKNQVSKLKPGQQSTQKETIVSFPKKFPFWARLKIGKNRTTLVIDEETRTNKQNREEVFVHREATHKNNRGDFEAIIPNPDKDDNSPMYLKRPTKLPKKLFKPHNKDLSMPEYLRERYEKNNK